jgi:hypothetical protein
VGHRVILGHCLKSMIVCGNHRGHKHIFVAFLMLLDDMKIAIVVDSVVSMEDPVVK